MNNAFFQVPPVQNEPVLAYTVSSPERKKLKEALQQARANEVEIHMFIDGKNISSGDLVQIRPPHDLQHILGCYHKGNETHVAAAIDAALKARNDWASMPWEQRAAIFLRAANLVSGPYRAKINAATMLGQSKNAYQAEIDSACELADFFRFNVAYASQIYSQQPMSAPTIWNRTEYRPLEGFIFALTPFNFTAIAGNLPTSPAIMGNVVVWKPSGTQIYSARVIMDILREAGLPDGVINLVFVSGPVAGNIIFNHPAFAGIHYTGSTSVFQEIWTTIGKNISTYKTYPRIVGETGGKDFIVVHPSANLEQSAVAIIRGAFEYQGQKCSAASRAYVPRSRWDTLREILTGMLQQIKMGSVEDFSNFVNAVIDENAFNKLSLSIKQAKADGLETIWGGNYNKQQGYFIEPTIFLTENPFHFTMTDELFGPIISIYLYNDNDYERTLHLVDTSSAYGLTGSVFANDRHIISVTEQTLVNAAGNFYINDKPTGAVVGQQPFGGARGSGTNDKAGSVFNLLRWVSVRSIKENLLPPTDFRYDFMAEP